MTVVYIVVVLVVCYIVKKKKSSAEITEKKPEFISAVLTALSKTVVALAVVYFGFAVFFFDMLIEDYWIFFNGKRTAEIESRYGIIVDDNIKLKKYKVIADMEGAMRTIEFESGIDGMDFMKKNCKGKLIQYAENNLLYDLKSPDKEPETLLLKDNLSGIYWYEYQGKKYYMNFYTEGDSYRVKTSYY